MSTRISKTPWLVRQDTYSGELHYMVVDADGAPLFDSVNRSPAADPTKEEADIYLAGSAPILREALLTAADALDRAEFFEEAKNARAVIAKATGEAA